MEQKKKTNEFEVIKVVRSVDFYENRVERISESDLLLTFPDGIVQFKYHEEEDKSLIDVEPGTFALISTNQIELNKLALRTEGLLESVDNTAKILSEAHQFFGNLKTYDALGIQKKRAALLYGPPGTGKTSSIVRVISKLMEEDPGTCAIVWNTSQVKAETVYNLFNFKARYSEKITRIVLVAEDIGGNEQTYHGHRETTSGLLNLLDGVDIAFKYPTFILATTNHPENLLESLADRPGRFDKMVSMDYPSAKERVELTAFIAKRDLTAEEIKAISGPGAEDFSIAHLKEVVVRSSLTGKSIPAVIQELMDHKELIRKNFEKRARKMGIGH